MPVLFSGYLIAYMDRSNLGFASIQMNKMLGIDPAIYGFGAGIFFIGYCLLDIPSNLLMKKYGARIWLPRIMFLWGIVSILNALIAGPTSFLLGRFMLGVAEGGFLPGAILYITYWFPMKFRARAAAIFMLAAPIAGTITGPVSGALLDLEGLLGLHGWQIVFIVEAMPAILLGFLSLKILVSDITEAKWLNDQEKQWLIDTQQSQSDDQRTVIGWQDLKKALTNKTAIILGFFFGGAGSVQIALAYWSPQLIKSFQFSNLETGFISAIPWLISAFAMIIWAHLSDRKQERFWYNIVPLCLSIITIVFLCMGNYSASVIVVCLTILGASISATKGPFWAVAGELLDKNQMAWTIGMINMVSNILLFALSYLMGWIRSYSDSFAYSIIPSAVIMGFIVIYLFIKKHKQQA